MFAAVIQGSGSLLSDKDEQGDDLPFFTTEQILKELERFGFYINYDVKSHLPDSTVQFLRNLLNLGYDKISKIVVDMRTTDGLKQVPLTVVFKSYLHNDDILVYGTRISSAQFNSKLIANSIVNITNEPDMKWDWVTYIANIQDILNENVPPAEQPECICDNNQSEDQSEDQSEGDDNDEP